VFLVLLVLISCQKRKNSYKRDDVIINYSKTIDTIKLDPDKEEKYLDILCKEIQEQDNSSLIRDLYFKIALRYYNLNVLNKYYTVTKKVFDLASIKKDSSDLAKSLLYIGDYYEAKTKSDSAFRYYIESEKLFTKLKDTLNMGKLALYKAGIFYDTGNFKEGEVEGIKSLRLLSRVKDTRLLYETNITIALCLKELSDYKEALEYFELSLKQLDQLEKENYSPIILAKSRASCYNNMGSVYEKEENYKKAILLYERGLKTKDLRKNYPKTYAMLLNNLGYSQLKLGKKKEVKKLLFESLKIRDSLQVKPGLVASYIRIGEFYLDDKDTVTSIVYFKRGLELAMEINSNSDILESLKLLVANDTKKKSYYSNLYFKITDSIDLIERETIDKFARIAYETREIEERNELLLRKNTFLFLCSVIFLIGMISVFLIYRLKIKNKKLSNIQMQQKLNEEIYQLMFEQQSDIDKMREQERDRIAMELHDGIVNTIFTTRFNLIQLQCNDINKKEELVKELEKAENEIRKVSHDLLKNTAFIDQGLPEILRLLVVSQQNQYHTKFHISIDTYIDWSGITSLNKIHIYRIIQEAIQNINKHSQAENCYIMLLKIGDRISIRILDNGAGFNSENLVSGIGLHNIKERVAVLKGEFKIYTSSTTGTTIEVIF
jgi:signal transduction histidine kinase